MHAHSAGGRGARQGHPISNQWSHGQRDKNEPLTHPAQIPSMIRCGDSDPAGAACLGRLRG